ncbi:MAG: hypothetical protein IJ675_03410 [Pseudobutyrivibrio sp.]|nr:hypothetical protein [Pseudobutyrivibrio sp.]
MKILNRIASIAIVMTLVVTAFLATPALTAEAKTASAGVAIGGAVIDGANVVVASSGSASSEDGLYHLVASDVYQTAPVGADVAQVPVSAAATFTFPLGQGTEASVLYKKFTVCVLKGGALSPVSNSMFITNPEAIATHSTRRVENGKKGLLADASSANMGMRSLATLGAKQATVTLELSKISGGSGTPYVYNGKTYNFNTRYISAYDNFLGRLNSQGVQVSMILVVDAAAQAEFINPLSYSGLGAHTYYGLNATNAEGAELLAAAGSFITARWSGNPYFGMIAKVDNFIIGNEVNAWYQWNYMNAGSMANYTKQYADAFRVLYTAIKSENANANVYVCTDHQWGFSQSQVYGARAFLTEFNNDIRSQGNIDWRLAFHAYNYPLTSTVAWAPNSNVQRSQSTRFVSVYNIDVVTDFLSQPELLSPSGAVRTVKLSEQGYTSMAGEDQQAAAVVYSILVANNNSHIDGIILSREKDDPVIEMPQGLANGLMDTSNHAKMSYSFYQNAESADVIAQASAIAGVDLTSTLAPR